MKPALTRGATSGTCCWAAAGSIRSSLPGSGSLPGGGTWAPNEVRSICWLRRAGRLIGILPLYLSQADGIHCLTVVGCAEVSDYLDLIIEAGQEEIVYSAFLSWLMGPEAPAWDIAELCNQPSASLTYTRLVEWPAAGACGWK